MPRLYRSDQPPIIPPEPKLECDVCGKILPLSQFVIAVAGGRKVCNRHPDPEDKPR